MDPHLKELLDERHEQVMGTLGTIATTVTEQGKAIVEIQTNMKWLGSIAATISAVVGGSVGYGLDWLRGRG